MPRVAKSKTPPPPSREAEDAPAPAAEKERLTGRLHLQFGPTPSAPGSRLKKR